MTTRSTYVHARAALPAAAIAALLLAGCSSGNVGESWQCPLAKGGTCDSVAAADPAVPDAGAAGRPLLREPLWRVRGSEPASQPESPACEASCDGGFDPFGWLLRLFGVENDGPEVGPVDDDARPDARESEPATAAGSSGMGPAPAGVPSPPSPLEAGNSSPAEPAAAALPAEPAPAGDDTDGDDLRTGEVVARIWIAPFVDAGGVYREASHVRMVLEPAGWRLPR